MKKMFIMGFFLLVALILAGCSNSDVNETNPEPLHYSQPAPDVIDVCRYDAYQSAGQPADFNLPDAVYTAGEKLGAALDTDTRIRVLLKKSAGVDEQQIYTDNYLIQVATPTGIRNLMARLDSTFETALFALDENAIYALPFRFMVIPDGSSMIHVCMVDPVAYLSQFTPVSDPVRKKLEEAVDLFENIIGETFPDAYFDPRKAPEDITSPKGLEPWITLGQVTGSLNTVATALQNGTLYYNDTAFQSGIDAFGDNNGTDGPEDIYALYENPTTRSSIEIRGFVPFKTFKDFRKGTTFNIPNMTDTMAFLVQNSLIHIFDHDRRQVYDVNGKTVYQLLIFDGHVDPMLINRGISHFASVPMSIFLTEESSGVVTVRMQNPEFKLMRYYSDLTAEGLSFMKQQWNANDPPSKLLFPDLTLEEFGEFSSDIAQRVFDAAMSGL